MVDACEFDPIARYEALGDWFATHGFADDAEWIDMRIAECESRGEDRLSGDGDGG